MYSPLSLMHLDVGQFQEKTHGHHFDYRAALCSPFGAEFPHEVYVGSTTGQTRYANVKKTVAYIVVDEDAFGNPVTEKWQIKTIWRKEN